LARSITVKNDELIIPLLDARRMEVYSAVFNSKYEQIRDVEAEIIDKRSFEVYLHSKKVNFLGDGASKCKETIKNKNAIFFDDYYPSAKEMAYLSYKKYISKKFEDVAYFEPYYLKDFIAGKPKKILN